jgi:hypothetical protein
MNYGSFSIHKGENFNSGTADLATEVLTPDVSAVA